MHPEDRVLVGVIQRKKDLEMAQTQGWYRIPEGKVPQAQYAQYLAFFLSRAFGDQNGGVHYYARKTGHELATRADLLPDEKNHARAAEIYQKFQIGELRQKTPPVLNASKRRFSFILTTWDRFVSATQIDDLYSKADYLVDRVFYGLRDAGYQPRRLWEISTEYPPHHAEIRVLCEAGELVASTKPDRELIINDNIDETLANIQREIAKMGGPKMLSIPLEY